MPGDRNAYKEAISAGAQAAWDQEWDRAIVAYRRAIKEFPEDPAAYVSVGLALLQAKRLNEALDAYVTAHKLAPDDPIPLERSADVYERLGRLKEAAENYVKVADILLGKRDVKKAIGNWERATRLSPGMLHIHSRLALAYERTNRRKSALREYLTIAAIFQRKGDTNRAIQACNRALRMDKNSPQVLNALQALQVGQKMRAPTQKPDRKIKTRIKRPAFGTGALQAEEQKTSVASDIEMKGPVGTAQARALSELATHLFESGVATQQSGMFAAKAIDLQRAGELGAAIAAYQRAQESGLNHAAFNLNLGSLLVEYGEYEKGIGVLKTALGYRPLAAGAYFATAQAYMALDNQRETIRHLLSALKLVDVEGGNGDPGIYTGMLRSAAQMSEDRLSALNQSLLAFMTGPGWRKNVAQMRSQLVEAAKLDGEAALLEMLATDQTGRIAAIMSRIDAYHREKLYVLAMDEAQYMIQLTPTYLPAHLRIAEILLSENRTRPAIDKFNMVAETYRARDDNQKAADILSRLIKMAPMDISVRKKRLQWLKEEERWSDVFREYINLADTYYQLADWDAARATYEEAEALAESAGASPQKIAHILHRIADIDVQRLELRAAMDTYKRIKKISPGDERARRGLIDLNYRLGNGTLAVSELDNLLRFYAQNRRIDKIVKLLEEMVMLYPDEMALRSRMARVYQQQRRIEDAVRQLDALGELQLEAGMRAEAVQTIRAIVAMNPPDRQSYLQLLQQLGQ